MTIGDIKNILYKKSELQNLEIQIFLFAGGLLKDEKIIKEIKFNNNDVILVVVQPKKKELYNANKIFTYSFYIYFRFNIIIFII